MGDLDSVYANLKACLISCKGGIPLKDLESEYFKLNGEQTAYKSYGFSSLEDLLRATDKFTFQNHGGVIIVQASHTQKTQHLSELIKKQKSKPIKRFTGNKTGSRSLNTSSNPNRLNNYSRQGNSNSSYGPPRNHYNNASIPNNTNSHKTSTSYNNIRPNQQKAHPGNNYSRNTNNYSRNFQANSGAYVGETKSMQQHNLLNDNTNYIQTDPTTNGTHPLHMNNKSHTKPAQKFPLTTSSSSSLESTFSSSSTSYTPKNLPTQLNPLINSLDKFQLEKDINITVSQINLNNKEQIQKNNIHIKVDEKNSEHTSQTQHQQHTPISIYPPTNMPLKSSTAQSRLQKYPKKCDETLNKVDGEKTITAEKPIQFNNPIIENDPCVKENDNSDYIEELESYLKNLNLPEPYYDCMVKKEKHGKTIRHLHISTIKINEKNISSFPVECNTVDYAKKVAAKHALKILKKQYGENIVYPIASDINMMAFHIKDFLKSGFEETGLMGDVLERMYREKFQENLPDNWVQLLEVFSCFTFDKLVANKIIIYLNKTDNDNHQNGHGDINGYAKAPIEENNIIPGTPLMFENCEEKSILVSANYGSCNIWIRFVGQNVDENFIQMQAKFNDTMNTTGFSIAEHLTEGEYYAVLYNSIWHRVQISGPIGEDGTVTCLMVDTGELYNVAKDQICNLEPVYMKTKLQAVECILSQFDNFGTFDGLKELLNEMILNKTFFAIPDSLEDCPRITLYEKGESSDRINVNDMIMKQFLKKTVVRLPHFEEHTLVDAIVSSFVESGHLYLQLNFDVISSLEEILPNDKCLSPEYFIKSKEDIRKDQVYLLKYEDDVWCRVQIIEIINDSEAKVIYIDYGNISKCEINKLVILEFFDPLMAMIPPQALKVSMNMIPPKLMTSDIAKKLFEIIGDDKVLVNVVNGNTALDDVPFIQLYKTDSSEEITSSGLCLNVQMFQSLNKQ